MAATRVCARCRQERPLTKEHFDPRSDAKPPFRRTCIECRNKQQRARDQSPKGKARAAALRDSGAKHEIDRRSREKHALERKIREASKPPRSPEAMMRDRARCWAWRQIREGALARPKACPDCGARARGPRPIRLVLVFNGGHETPEQRLDHRWSCPACLRASAPRRKPVKRAAVPAPVVVMTEMQIIDALARREISPRDHRGLWKSGDRRRQITGAMVAAAEILRGLTGSPGRGALVSLERQERLVAREEKELAARTSWRRGAPLEGAVDKEQLAGIAKAFGEVTALEVAALWSKHARAPRVTAAAA